MQDQSIFQDSNISHGELKEKKSGKIRDIRGTWWEKKDPSKNTTNCNTHNPHKKKVPSVK